MTTQESTKTCTTNHNSHTPQATPQISKIDMLLAKASETLCELKQILTQKTHSPTHQFSRQENQPKTDTRKEKLPTAQLALHTLENPHQRHAAVTRALKIREIWLQHQDIEEIMQQTGYSPGYIDRYIKIAETILADPELASMITAEATNITYQDIDTFTACYESIHRVRDKFIQMAKKDGLAATLKKMRTIMGDIRKQKSMTQQAKPETDST